MSATSERVAPRRERLLADPSLQPHGSASTYCNWGCRCSDCKAAWTETCLKARARRTWLLASGQVEKPHGSVSTYVNWGCRCRPCTDAHTALANTT